MAYKNFDDEIPFYRTNKHSKEMIQEQVKLHFKRMAKEEFAKEKGKQNVNSVLLKERKIKKKKHLEKTKGVINFLVICGVFGLLIIFASWFDYLPWFIRIVLIFTVCITVTTIIKRKRN